MIMSDAERKLNSMLNNITDADETTRKAAEHHWQKLAKPLGSLGVLEEDVCRTAALTENTKVSYQPRSVYIFCADNGVVAQGVTQTGSKVTGIVADELAARRTAVCRMAETANCAVVPVDMGIKDYAGNAGVMSRRVGNGTQDLSQGPAMTREQAVQAVLTGISIAGDAKAVGQNLLAAGEMGIGNTTTASAIATVLLNRPAEEMTGKGAGLSDEGLQRKIHVIKQSIARNRPNPEDVLDVLSKEGGFDIAGMCGLYLGGGYYKIPVLTDGLIANVAALCAVRLCPNARKAILASHVSKEPAAKLILQELGCKPLISAGMYAGEGTGAVAAMPLLDMAAAVYTSAYTFKEGGIEPYRPC